ncbi:MAG TPA: nucleotide exchange factor GrpE, partial [Desulfuromonadaceae bacterium]|nr:nucleotide exchange factor GrpE [Desulfuromonadaceae bacterium]
EPFNAERHQAVDDEAPPADAVIVDTIGTGYTFQGKLLRPALVQLRAKGPAPAPEQPAAPAAHEEGSAEDELPLQSPD